MTQPVLVVELGYLSGWELGTSLLGTSTYLATVDYSQDISDLVRSVSIRRGRQHELNRMEAGTAQVVVLNQDGAMTLIPPMTSIRIRAELPTSPVDIAGLVAWYDFSVVASNLWQDTARTSAVTADGQTIKGVTDKSGNGKHLSEATNGPTYKTSILNGLSVARFDGTNDILTATMAADTSFTVFIMAKKRSAPAAPQSVFGVDNFRAQLTANAGWSATAYAWYWNEATTQVLVGGVVTNLTALVLKVNSAASLDVYMSGGTPTNFDPADTLTSGTTYTYGAAADISNFGDYDIGEVVIYNSALSSANLNSIGDYLATKWGITWTPVS